MRMKMFAMIALSAVAAAQGPPPGRGGGRGRMGFDSPPGLGGDFGPGVLRSGVKNAPFTADVVTESSHTLADGNRIRQAVNSKVYRDSEGRTRREQTVTLNGLLPNSSPQPMVFINDPVSGVNYSLNSKDRTGFKSVRSSDGRGGPPRGPMSPDAVGRGPGGMGRRGASDSNFKTESLGRQTIEGLQAEGRRTTMTIPAGQAGNELPIHIVNESWYSAELQTTLLSKHSDPRNGDTVTRLINISRTEPARILFEAPADFKLSEMEAGGNRNRRGPTRQ
ncbi:MAG: hypothetical protein ABI806_11805 [Candidatus Solibacter sp.]